MNIQLEYVHGTKCFILLWNLRQIIKEISVENVTEQESVIIADLNIKLRRKKKAFMKETCIKLLYFMV